MRIQDSEDLFVGVETVVAEPLKFKAKLQIGEDAYNSLRMKNKLGEIWEVAGVAGTAAVVAQSSTVASAFFAPVGIWAILGLGAAATPIGWVVGAALVSGGAWYGVTRYLKEDKNNKVMVIPHFINTPMDVLALGLFDLMAPLALKVAVVDGSLAKSERNHIRSYFVNDWGYDQTFVDRALSYTERQLSEFSIKKLTDTLAQFVKSNRDCNFDGMSKEIIAFLKNLVEADGKVDEREEMAIKWVEAIFSETGRFNFLDLPEKIRKTFEDVFSKEEANPNNPLKDTVERGKSECNEVLIRLESATEGELIKMRSHLGIKHPVDADKIDIAYRETASSVFDNALLRKKGERPKVTYKEILVDVLEAMKPFAFNMADILEPANVPKREDSHGPAENAYSYSISELERMIVAFHKEIESPKRFSRYYLLTRHLPVGAGSKTIYSTLELILIGQRQAIEMEAEIN